MKKILYLLTFLVTAFLIFTIYRYDLSSKEIHQYNKKVTIYTKENCSFCKKAQSFLEEEYIPYEQIDLTWDRDLYAKLSLETKQRTVPFVFIDEKFIGGCKELLSLHSKGVLIEYLK